MKAGSDLSPLVWSAVKLHWKWQQCFLRPVVVVPEPFSKGCPGKAEIYLLFPAHKCFCRGLKVHITHCDVLEGSKCRVCACAGAEAAVKQQQLKWRIKGQQQDPMCYPWRCLVPCYGQCAERKVPKGPSVGQVVVKDSTKLKLWAAPLHASVCKEWIWDWGLKV